MPEITDGFPAFVSHQQKMNVQYYWWNMWSHLYCFCGCCCHSRFLCWVSSSHPYWLLFYSHATHNFSSWHSSSICYSSCRCCYWGSYRHFNSYNSSRSGFDRCWYWRLGDCARYHWVGTNLRMLLIQWELLYFNWIFKREGKVWIRAKWPVKHALITDFCSMKVTRSTSISPGWDANPSKKLPALFKHLGGEMHYIWEKVVLPKSTTQFPGQGMNPDHLIWGRMHQPWGHLRPLLGFIYSGTSI